MFYKMMGICFLLIAAISPLNGVIKNVIFDLDVLFDYAQTGVMAQGALFMMGKSVDGIRNRLFEILAAAACPEVSCAHMMYKGKQMPQLWCAYYLDLFTPEEVLTRAHEVIEKKGGWLEKKALIPAATYAFSPHKEIELITPNESMFALVQSLIARGIKVIICTNKNSASWQAFNDTYPDHLGVFAHTAFISGFEKVLKPSKQAYDKLKARFGLNPKETLCIESQPEYLEIIAGHGFQVIHASKVLSDESCACIEVD